MNNQLETSQESNPIVAELLAIRTELKKTNQKLIDVEKTANHNSIKSWQEILSHKPLILISSLLIFNILASLLQSITNTGSGSYEYNVVSPPDSIFENSMTDYGKDGWQVVSCRRATSSYSDSASYECIMMRKK